jgi:LacI family transcriptional regulator
MPNVKKVILLIESSRGYGRDLLNGIAEYSRLHGPWSFYREPGGLDSTLPPLFNWDADGIIMRDSARTESLVSLGVPIILVLHKNPPRNTIPCIVTDDVAIGTMAAEHFLDKGFHNFAYCGLDNMHWSRNRRQSFRERIRQAGFKTHVYKQPMSETSRSWENEQIILAKWLAGLPKPLALMACNDDRAQYTIEACKLANIAIPDQIAVLGADDDKLVCNLTNPRLSSVSLTTERAGYETAELLEKLMNGDRAASRHIIVHPMHVAARQSTDVLAVRDREVAKALRFIKNHAREVIQVNDVAEATEISRRVLEKRFRQTINHSVLEMIRNARAEQTARLLVETNISVAQIAETLGYPGVKHISRSFRQAKGMSPLAYRKKYGQK